MQMCLLLILSKLPTESFFSVHGFQRSGVNIGAEIFFLIGPLSSSRSVDGTGISQSRDHGLILLVTRRYGLGIKPARLLEASQKK